MSRNLLFLKTACLYCVSGFIFALFPLPSIGLQSVMGHPSSPASSSLIAALEIAEPIEFSGDRVPLDNQDVRERFEKEVLLCLWDRPQVLLWLKRSRRYLPFIEKTLKEAGLPTDLKYIAVAESALRPHAQSSKGAVGFWQFTKGTAREYSLTVNEFVDQRRNIVDSTEAAVSYLKDLYNMLGSWTLAAAAFNMGEDGLMAEIVAQGTDDYYRLYLPLETQRYVPRIVAVKLILSNPEQYGFYLTDDDYYPPLSFDRVAIDLFREVPLKLLAGAAKTDFKVLKDLNPEVRGHFMSPGRHTLLVPKGAASGFHSRYEQLLTQWLADVEERIYVVQEGDNLTSIAARFRVPLTALIIWNGLNANDPIHPGD